MRINQNIAAFNAYRNLTQTQNQQASSLEKLSSGFRINRAADDASGLVNSENLRSQIGGLKVAQRNAQDAISLVQTAEGAQTEVHSILQRMRDLTVQSGNLGTNDTAALKANQDEINELAAELDRISEQTQFGTKTILNGRTEELTAAIGDGDDAATIQGALATQFGGVAADYDLSTITLDDGTTLADVAADGDTGVALGENLNFASQSFVFQVGANSGQTVSVSVAGVNSSSLGVDALDVASGDAEAIGLALDAIDAAIGTVSENRATLGAFQNRMESTIRNVGVAVENLSAAESRIRDTDMAEEMVNFTRSQILSQAGTAMLAQANMVPQSVLSLLG